MVINFQEAEEQLSQLLDRAHSGEEVVIFKGGEPYARLCPLAPPVPRTPGLLKGALGSAFFDPLPDDELEAWEK
jgi:antitoxin (DNA-binding transcriptional repressor) of toxin-antitoxin stability system